MGDPEGNLAIVERVVHENQRSFPDWAHGWGGTAHVLTSTYDGTVKQKEQEKKLTRLSTFDPRFNFFHIDKLLYKGLFLKSC